MISYQTEGVKMPDIKKKKTTGWIKEVAHEIYYGISEILYRLACEGSTADIST